MLAVRHRLTVLVAAGVVTLAGCSSATGTPVGIASSATAAAAAPSPAAPAPSATEATASPATGEGPDSTPDGQEVRDTTPGDPVECLSAANAAAAVGSGFLAVLQGRTGGEAFDPAPVIDGLARVRAQVPTALGGDIDTLAAAARSLTGGTLDDATAVFHRPDVTQAAEHVEQWVSDHC
ncbi:hypothetical protein [Nakamurella endophytica]|uniref:Lipoprotein n=1 Tax=Nakamurella endophytica TaxID=1748367 RepID=A0A917WDX2_9ACTN|nr:hypothetical protein [Nakamurella endophytica]GGL98247.1 hypothetical protein GCM10011594_17720 [Nakamurella endophytica]